MGGCNQLTPERLIINTLRGMALYFNLFGVLNPKHSTRDLGGPISEAVTLIKPGAENLCTASTILFRNMH